MSGLSTVVDILHDREEVGSAVAIETDLGGGSAVTVAAVELASYCSGPMLRTHVKRCLAATDAPLKAPFAGVLILNWLPIGMDGAVDLAEVQRVAVERADEFCFVEPRGLVERQLAEVWEKELGCPGIGVRDDFLELGGDSYHAFRVLAEVENRFGVTLDIFELMDVATVQGMAELLIERGVARDDDEALVLEIWREVLGVQTVGFEDDFFGAGGDSYSAADLVSRLGEATGIDIPLGFVYERRTARAQAADLRALPQAQARAQTLSAFGDAP